MVQNEEYSKNIKAVFKDRLRKARKEAGYKHQINLINAIDAKNEDAENPVFIGVATLSEYERGVHFPSIETLVFLADFLGCSLDYLLGLSDDPKPSCLRQNDPGQERRFQFETYADVVTILEHLLTLNVISYFEGTQTKSDNASGFKIETGVLNAYFRERNAIYKLEGTISEEMFNNVLATWGDGARKRLKDLSEWKHDDKIGCFCKAIPAEFTTIDSDDPTQVIKGFRLEIDDSHKKLAAHETIHAIFHPEESEET